jgi:protein-L-isoaspartate O-methyltransferase
MFEEQLARLEQALWQVAERAFGQQVRRHGELVEAIVELSRRYNETTGGEQGRAEPGCPPAATSACGHDLELAARLVFFTLGDLTKAGHVLGELSARHELPDRPLRVLDVGAGCGAMSLGLLALLERRGQSPPVAIDAVDRDGAALALFESVLGELAPSITVHTHRQDVAAGLAVDGAYDLVLAGNLFVELPAARHQPLAQALLERLGPRGHLVVLEPALRRTSRDLHRLRDELLARGAATVFAPCTRAGPCPALARETDWCHEARVWQPPPRLRQLASATRLRRRDLTWSYLALNRHDAHVATAPLWRVVSERLDPKGKHEVYLCGEPGRWRATLLRRHRSPGNEPFRHLDRGRLVRIDGELARTDQGLRLGAASLVTVEDPVAAGCA